MFPILAYLLWICPLFSYSEEVLGCGGYIMSAVGIDYSHVTIKLLTQQGNEKYETECAPNNGYYFIPIYDKGDYVIKVFSPSGWTFEPKEFPVKIDGSTDLCSQGKDINFQFGGFAVIGKVVSEGSIEGAANIKVSLIQNGKEIMRTSTTQGGNYQFTPLAPGNYIVKASHERWSFKNDQATVHVTDKNGDAANSLVMEGYHLTGSVSNLLKYADKFYLVLNGKNIDGHTLGCTKGLPKDYGSAALCYVEANKKGEFTFTKLLPGTYTISPYFPTLTQHNIWPSKFDVTIQQADSDVGNIFKVNGGSLKGKVLSSPEGAAIAGAKVTLDATAVSVSNDEGVYSFPRVEFGKHIISVSAENMEFEPLEAHFSMDTPSMPAVYPEKLKVCLSVHLDAAERFSKPWLITIKKSDERAIPLEIASNMKVCIYLPRGKYIAEIQLPEEAKQQGVRFIPTQHTFNVNSQPIPNLSFSQFLGEIHGKITCLSNCPSLTVHLRSSTENSVQPQTVVSSHGQFIFRDVTPGEYTLSLDKEEWCWKEQNMKVVVNEKKVSTNFQQTGYRLTINASHKMTLSYYLNADVSGEIDVPTGTSRQCMPRPGKYKLTHTSCHRFASQDISWDTSAPQLVSLIAKSHRMLIHLKSKEPSSFSIIFNPGESQKEMPMMVSNEDKNLYVLEYWPVIGEHLVVSPHSSSNLFQFTPEKFEISVEDDCMDPLVFDTQRALFLKGSVTPPTKGADIIVNDGTKEVIHHTNADGIFIVGPLDRSKSYNVRAEKVGYTVDPPSFSFADLSTNVDVIKAHFNVHKLAEIIVKVVDGDDALQGVLVSTSGGKNYRQNSLTDADGVFVFQSLLPNEYFVRPMMKEYVFEPSSKILKVEEGQSVDVLIKGSRVAFSVFGRALTLNGQPEPDVVLEAIGTGEKCFNMQEETTTDASGNYRIRSLVPKCEYTLQLKRGDGINQHIEVSIPNKKDIIIDSNDIFNIDLILIRPFNQMDIAVMLHTDPKFLNSISVELYRDSMPDSPIHIVKPNGHPFLMFPILVMDNKSYSIMITSSLPSSRYTIESSQQSFIANSSFKTFHMDFNASYKTEDAEISNSTLFGMFLFVACVTCIFNYEKIQPIIEEFIKGNNMKTKKKVVTVHLDTPQIEPVLSVRKVRARKT